jgi:predicted outer membrane protein
LALRRSRRNAVSKYAEGAIATRSFMETNIRNPARRRNAGGYDERSARQLIAMRRKTLELRSLNRAARREDRIYAIN